MSAKEVCCVACNTQPPGISAPPTRVATHGKQVASASEEWRALPKPCGVAHNSFGTAGITNEIHIPAAQGGPRGGAVMDLRTGKWKMASTPLSPPIDRNKSPLQISGKVAGCVVRTLETFQGTHVLGASRGLLCDSSAVLS